MVVKMDIPIRLLHGYLEPRLFLHGIHRHLNRLGFTDVQKITYPSYHRSWETVVDKAEKSITDSLSHPHKPVILIGHSLGGAICSRLRNLNVYHSIMITSPLQGNFLVKNMKRLLGSTLSKIITGRAATSLDHRFITPAPPFPYTTISAAIKNQKTDGIVGTSEMIIEDENNIHIDGIDHLSILFSQDLYRILTQVLNQQVLSNMVGFPRIH